jgi:hypothetical protein
MRTPVFVVDVGTQARAAVPAPLRGISGYGAWAQEPLPGVAAEWVLRVQCSPPFDWLPGTAYNDTDP